jgi:hypothetical protein
MIKCERMYVLVGVPVPPGATRTDVVDYVREAVQSMSGSFEPPNEGNAFTGNPLFGIRDHGPVTARAVRAK